MPLGSRWVNSVDVSWSSVRLPLHTAAHRRKKEEKVTVEENKRVVRRFYDEVLNSKAIDVLPELAVADYEEHDMLPGQGTGLAGLRDRVTMLTHAIDQRFTLED